MTRIFRNQVPALGCLVCTFLFPLEGTLWLPSLAECPQRDSTIIPARKLLPRKVLKGRTSGWAVRTGWEVSGKTRLRFNNLLHLPFKGQALWDADLEEPVFALPSEQPLIPSGV